MDENGGTTCENKRFLGGAPDGPRDPERSGTGWDESSASGQPAGEPESSDAPECAEEEAPTQVMDADAQDADAQDAGAKKAIDVTDPFSPAKTVRWVAEHAGDLNDGPGFESQVAHGIARSLRKRRSFIVCMLLACALMAAIALVALSGASLFGGVSTDAVRSVLQADREFMDGFASNDYVEKSEYELSDVRVLSSTTEDDGSVSVEASAKLVNESFESLCNIQMIFASREHASDFPELAASAPASGLSWVGAIVDSSATTVALAGVTHDPDFPSGFEPKFDEESQTCTFTSERTFDLWFGTSVVKTPYIYSFDGDRWTRRARDAEQTVAYKRDVLEGEYAGTSAETRAVKSFRIVGVDGSTGEFSVEYALSTPGFPSHEVSGVLMCELEVAKAGESADSTASEMQADGYRYGFSGKGTSSEGDGASEISGVIGRDGAIRIDLAADYTARPLFGEPGDETMEVSGSIGHR